MPYKPLHPCNHPGCPNLTRERFCDVHRKQEHSNYNKYTRDKVATAFYNSPAWRSLSKLKLARDPFCEICRGRGEFVKATCVDHVKEMRDDGVALDIENLQSLCQSCHSRKSLLERQKRRIGPGGG